MTILTNVLRCSTLAAFTLLAACSSPGDRAHDACMAKVEEGMKQAGADLGGAAVGKEFMDAMRTAASASCEAIRDVCNKDPDGVMCKNALSELGD